MTNYFYSVTMKRINGYIQEDIRTFILEQNSQKDCWLMKQELRTKRDVIWQTLKF